jgi:3-oxoadipate enol-lactonase
VLHHRIDGSGPHLLLLHPVGLDLTFFDRMVDELRHAFAILRVDANGHGRTRATAGPATLEAYAEDIHQTLVGLGWRPTAVVGFSFGGMLAQILALSHPEDVQALIIAACASTFSDDARRAIEERGRIAAAKGMAAVVEPTLERWFSEAFLRTAAADRVRARLFADDVTAWVRAWKAIAAVDTAPRLGEIRIPTLCLAGGADRSAPPPIVEAIARAIPGAAFEVIPGAPHMMFVERPAEVASAIEGFLSRRVG